jgi:hypothetical protein
MFNVTPKVHLRLSHERPRLNLARLGVSFNACHVCKYQVFQEIID